MAMIFVPLPRRVGPTCRSLFSPGEGLVDERLAQIKASALAQVLGQGAQQSR
jgi:hypothetical protein